MFGDHFNLARKPPETLSHVVQQYQDRLQRYMSPELEGRFRWLAQTCHLADVVRTYPPIQKIQCEINAVMVNNHEQLYFDTPALLDAVSKHLGRPQRFTNRIKEFTPTVAELIASLVDLHTRKPLIHQAIIQLIFRASLYQQAPHPKRYTCPLCSHMLNCTLNPSPKARTDTFRTEPVEGPAHASVNGCPVCRCCHKSPLF